MPTASPASGPAPLTVAFTANVPDGSLYQWQYSWNPALAFVPDYSNEFSGDTTYTYSSVGSHTARLRVYLASDGSLVEHSVPVVVLPPPVPPVVTLSFTPFPTEPNFIVNFTATAVASPGRTIASYQWDFNADGIVDASTPGGPTATAANVYGVLGTFNPVVTAIDSGELAGSASTTVKLSRPPGVTLTMSPVPAIPNQAVTFTATATPAAGWAIDTYRWDFGDGSPIVPSGPATIAHAFTVPGSYTVNLTVTDTAGQFTTVPSQVWCQPPPSVLIQANPFPGQPNQITTLTALVNPGPGGSIVSYTWSFGDGTPGVTLATNSVDHTYVLNGSYLVSVTVTPLSGAPVVATLQLPVAPIAKGLVITFTPPNVAVFLGPTPPGPQPMRVGHQIPFEVNATGGTSSLGQQFTVAQVFWDFDGDGFRDFAQDFTAIPQASVTASASFQYQSPGPYTVKVRVKDSNGLVGSGQQAIMVTPATLPLECWIAQPRDGSRLWGNHVTLQARATPVYLTRRVEFKYRGAGTTDPWTLIGKVSPPPFVSLTVPWDVTQVPPGDYELLAEAFPLIGAGALSTQLHTVTVAIDPVSPTQVENSDGAGGSAFRTQTIDPNEATRSESGRDTVVDLPGGAALGYSQLRIERTNRNPHPLEARAQNLTFLPGSFRRLSLGTGGEALSRPSRVTLYHTDSNEVLESLRVDTTKLSIFQFDEAERQWVPLFAQVSQPQEALLQAGLVSMGDIGIVGTLRPREPSGSSSGSCAALGIEFLLLPLLAAMRRRRS